MNDTDFCQFNGAFDAPMEPDAAFVVRLQKRMAQEAPAQATVVRSPVRSAMPGRPDRQPAASTRSHPLFIAAAVLVVFALAVASVVQLAPRVLEPQYASNAQATLPADANSTPGPDVTLAPTTLPGIGRVSYYKPFGESLVAVTWELDSEEQRLVSYNLISNSLEWETDVSGSDHFLFGDDLIIGVSYTFPDSQSENAMHQFEEMVAWDRTTGEEMWRSSIAQWDVVYGWESVDVAGDSVVYIGAGELVALDIATGQERWQARYDLHVPLEENNVQPPATVTIDDRLYIAQVDGMVEVFDAATGKQTIRFELPAHFAAMHPVGLQLFQVPAGLLLVADRYTDLGPTTLIMVVDPADGSVAWERSLDSTGLVSVAPDGSIAVAMYTWENPPLLLRLLQQDGYATAALLWLDATGGTILETERVRMPGENPLVIAGNGTYACITAEELGCFNRSGTKHLTGVQDGWNAVFVGDTLLVFTDAGVKREDLP